MNLNFFLKKGALRADTFINMVQNRVINLPMPKNELDLVCKKYLDEQLAKALFADKIPVSSRSSKKETVQQSLENLVNKQTRFLPKSGGTMGI